MKKVVKITSWIKKNKFQAVFLFLLIFLTCVISYDVYARTAGKISDPIVNWPTDDKGYIGHPGDALVDTGTAPQGNETIFNLLGKIYKKFQ